MITKITSDLNEVIAALKSDLPVAVPTETVYGLAANASSDVAVKRVFGAKNRPADHPLIVHIGAKNQLTKWVEEIPEAAAKLIDVFWPGPLTLVLPKKQHVSYLITGGLETVAVRMPDHPLLIELLQGIDFALVAPSANSFTHISPTSAEHVIRSLNSKIPLVLDGGPCRVGIESTIVAFEDNKPIILRHGAISLEQIEAIVEDVSELNSPTTALLAPGMHAVHYAPRTRCYRVDSLNDLNLPIEKRIGIISLLPIAISERHSNWIYGMLDETGDLTSAARHLYRLLHEFDQMNLDMILIETVPNIEQGRALNDRIMRASIPLPKNVVNK